jgi:catechol 2,3-dioxygenase-like lactoylglutathione lyase family enzyme
LELRSVQPTEDAHGGVTLRDRINRIAYLVVNVTDLERSRAFYEAVTPLRVVARTQTPAQPFKGLGIEHGQFDGYLMDDGTGGPPTQLHLVEWKSPLPIGQAYPTFWNVGLAKLAVRTPSAPSKLAQLRELGIAPTNKLIQRGYVSIVDPDGATVSFPGSHTDVLPAGEDPRRFEQFLHVNPSVSDIRRSMHFYGSVLGLDLWRENVACAPIASSHGPGSDMSQWDSHLYTARGDGRFKIDLSQYHFPAPTPESLVPYAEANHVGIARIGLEVDDLDACHQLLLQLETYGVCKLQGGPEEWDYGEPVGRRRVLNFFDPDGIRLELTEKVVVEPVSSWTQPINPPPLLP